MFTRTKLWGVRTRALFGRRAGSKAIVAACEALEARLILSVNAPTGLVAARESATQVQLRWKDNSGEDGFRIARRAGSSTADPVIINVSARGDETYEYTDGVSDPLIPDTTYYYEVQAFKAGNTPSAYSGMAIVETNRLPGNWGTTDVGGVPEGANPGEAGESRGVFTLDSEAGAIGTASEAFRYAYFPVEGDFTLVTQVASANSLSNQSFAQAGIMVRESLDASSENAAITTSPVVGNQTVRFQWREGMDSEVSTLSPSPPGWQPLLLKLVRTGARIDAYYSSNGAWPEEPSATKTIEGLNPLAYVGLLVSSHQSGPEHRHTATFDQFAFVSSSTGEPAGLRPGRPDVAVGNWHTVNLAWTDHSSLPSPQYEVERTANNGHTWQEVEAPMLFPSMTTHADDTASPETRYQYRVRVVGSNLYSLASSPVAPASPPPAPEAPSGLKATGVDGGHIQVEWVDNSNKETGFRLEYLKDGESEYQQWGGSIVADDNIVTSAEVGGLERGTRYTFRVRAINGSGESAWSNAASAFTGVNQNDVEADSRRRTHAIRVSWPDATGEAGYAVYRRNAWNGGEWLLAGTVNQDVTYFDDSGHNEPGGVLAEETPYEYGVVVKAHEAGENSGRSLTLQAAETERFLLIDVPQVGWNQGEGLQNQLLGIPGQPNVYHEQWICVGPVTSPLQLSADPNAQRRCEAIARAGKNVVIDIEHWAEDQRGTSPEAVQEAIDDFRQVIAWIREEWAEMQAQWEASGQTEGMNTSGLRLGLYEVGVNLFSPSDDPHEQIVIDAWQASNNVLGEGLMRPFAWGGNPNVKGVDFLVPVFYTDGTNWSEWIALTRLQLQEFRRLGSEYGIPVYVFVHPRDIITWAKYPMEMWRYELESIRSLADGVAVWYGGQGPFNLYPMSDDNDANYTNDPWYDELEEFRDQWDRLPPGAPSEPAVDQYGPFVSWMDSAVEDAGHDARGWVIERSRDGTVWVPVAGAYAGDEESEHEHSVHDYFATRDEDDGIEYHYRVRAINAFGSKEGAAFGPVTTDRHASRLEAELTDDRHVDVLSAMTLDNTHHGTWARYNDIRFDGNEERLLVRYKKFRSGTIHVWAMPPDTSVTIDSNGWSVFGTEVTEIATIPLENTDDEFRVFEILSSFPSGVRDVMVTFQRESEAVPSWAGLVQLDWMQFLPPAPPPAPGAPMTIEDDTANDAGTLAVTDAKDGGAGETARPPAVQRPRAAARVSAPARTAVAKPFATRRRRIVETTDESILT